MGYRESLADSPPSGADQCQGYRGIPQHSPPLGGLFDQVCNGAGTPPVEVSSPLTGTSQPGHRMTASKGQIFGVFAKHNKLYITHSTLNLSHFLLKC